MEMLAAWGRGGGGRDLPSLSRGGRGPLGGGGGGGRGRGDGGGVSAGVKVGEVRGKAGGVG